MKIKISLLLLLILLIPASLALAKGRQPDKVMITGPGLASPIEVTSPQITGALMGLHVPILEKVENPYTISFFQRDENGELARTPFHAYSYFPNSICERGLVFDPYVSNRLARQGDQAAWEALMRAHQEPVFRLAYLLLGDADEAEDITQETFLRAYKALKGFDAERPLRPWLLRIASNLAHNRHRSIGRYLAALTRFARQDPDGIKQTALEPKDDSQALWQAVQKLAEPFQQVIYLRYFLDMPESEMVDALDVPPGTVKSRLHRALTKLRGIVERDYPELKEIVK